MVVTAGMTRTTRRNDTIWNPQPVQDREALESAWGDVVSRTSDFHTTARGCVEHLVDREVDQMHHAAARLLPYSILYMARRLNKLDVICIDWSHSVLLAPIAYVLHLNNKNLIGEFQYIAEHVAMQLIKHSD